MTHLSKADWDSCRDPALMLPSLNEEHSPQFSTFGCRCCRRVWHFVIDDRLQNAIEVRESYDRGEASEEALKIAVQTAMRARWEIRQVLVDRDVSESHPSAAVGWAAGAIDNATKGNYIVASEHAARAAACGSDEWHSGYAAERASQCDLLRSMIAYPHSELNERRQTPSG